MFDIYNTNEGEMQRRPVWPKVGDFVPDLFCEDRLIVFLDSSFLLSAASDSFLNEWRGLMENNGARVLYIAEYEMNKAMQDGADKGEDILCVIPAESADLLFEEMSGKSTDINIVWLSASVRNAIIARDAAEDKGIYLRWYGIGTDGRVKLLLEDEETVMEAAVQEMDDEVFGEPEECVETEPEDEFIDEIIGDDVQDEAVSKKAFAQKTDIVTIEKVSGIPVPAPTSGAVLTAELKNGTCRLCEPIMTDHTSITYKTDIDGFYAKIYTQRARELDVFENKARVMLREKVEIKGVCWPVDILTDEDGHFLGILVPASRGVQLTRSVLGGEAKLRQNFPSWNKIDLCTLAHTMIDTIKKVHRLGVRFGCFNPSSVYLRSPEEVYFVDCDAWQIEGYPVMSKNVTFTPPELIDEMNTPRLYNQDEENYQTALLFFMIMLPGKYPYAKQKSEEEFEGIRERSFPFSAGGGMRRVQDSEKPSGAWQIVWDHLPIEMRRCMYKTFHPKGEYAQPGTRLKEGVWIKLADKFKDELMKEENALSRELFPYTFRRYGERRFVRCDICGREHPDFYFLKNIYINGEKVNIEEKGYRVCLPCAVDQSRDSFICKCCGKEFFYNNRTSVMHRIGKDDYDWRDQKWCSDCKKRTVKCVNCGKEVPINQIRDFNDKQFNTQRRVCSSCFTELVEEDKRRREEAKRWREAAYDIRMCRECGRSFIITNAEYEYFTQRRLHLPTRCRDCRTKR